MSESLVMLLAVVLLAPAALATLWLSRLAFRALTKPPPAQVDMRRMYVSASGELQPVSPEYNASARFACLYCDREHDQVLWRGGERCRNCGAPENRRDPRDIRLAEPRPIRNAGRPPAPPPPPPVWEHLCLMVPTPAEPRGQAPHTIRK